MITSAATRLAVLGLPADLGRQRIPFDAACLRGLLTAIQPDLVCAEITREAWEAGDLARTEADIREALAPATAATDIVLVPVVPTLQRFDDYVPDRGWRRAVTLALARLLRWGQRLAGRPGTLNGPLFSAFCHVVCGLSEMAWNVPQRAAWEAQTQSLADNVMRAVQRDPGRRVLVVVQCQRLHRLLPRLAARRDILEIVNYRAL